jgi:hypothetical protein
MLSIKELFPSSGEISEDANRGSLIGVRFFEA